MTIDKLPSGSYRIRLMKDGKRYAITVPYKPKDDVEAYRLILEHINNPIDKYATMTFREAYERFERANMHTLSESTIKGYYSMFKKIPSSFKSKELRDIDSVVIQEYINEYSSTHAPKSTRNMNAFIMTVIHMYYPDKNYRIKLPQKEFKEKHIPTEDEVKKLFEYVKGTHREVSLFLCMMSLRSCELMALELSDLDDKNMLTINKSKVKDKNGKWVVRNAPKNDSSNRIIPIPEEIADLIREQGFIYKGSANTLNHWLENNCEKIGIEYFSLHALRHFFVSYAHKSGYSNAFIQKLGGWRTDNVMKRTYRHDMEHDTTAREISDKISSFL